MAKPGPKKTPALKVVREGNPGKRPVQDSVTLPPSALLEPDWDELLPGRATPELRFLRQTAGELWRRTAPTLVRSVGLVGEQREVLVDYCITWARIVQGERALARQGVIVVTERGQVKNAWTTVLNQYRPHFRSLIGELGLSPAAAASIARPESDDDDDPFD